MGCSRVGQAGHSSGQWQAVTAAVLDENEGHHNYLPRRTLCTVGQEADSVPRRPNKDGSIDGFVTHSVTCRDWACSKKLLLKMS